MGNAVLHTTERHCSDEEDDEDKVGEESSHLGEISVSYNKSQLPAVSYQLTYTTLGLSVIPFTMARYTRTQLRIKQKAAREC